MSTSPGPSWRWTSDALSERIVQATERTLGVQLPADYRACVKENHGGAPEPAEFAFQVGDRRETSGVGLLLTLDTREDENVVETARVLSSEGRLPEGLVPIIDDGGGNFVCLDYRADPSRKSATIAHLSIGGEVAAVAGSFSELLGMLGSA